MLELFVFVVVVGSALGAAWIYRDPILAFMDMATDRADDAVDQLAEEVEEIEDKIDEIKATLGAIPSADELMKMTKDKIEELGREIGVELDKRKTKAKMVADLESAAKKGE